MQQDSIQDSHHCYGITKQTENEYGKTRAKISTVMNDEVKTHCRSVTDNIFTVVVLLLEISTSIAKPKVYLEAYPAIRQPSVTVTSNSPVIYSSLFRSLFFNIMMKTNVRFLQSRRWKWSTVDSEVRNIAALFGTRSGTEK